MPGDLGQTPVRAVGGKRAVEEDFEPYPRVLLLEPGIGEREVLLECVLEDGVDQILLGGEVAVERPHAEPGVVGDVLDRDVDAALCEEAPRGGDQTFAVASRITANDLDHRATVAETERSLRFHLGVNLGQ